MDAEIILAALAGKFTHTKEGTAMEAETRPAIRVTAKEIRAIEEIIRRRNQAEIKVEQGQIVVIEIRRKKVN